MSKLCGDKGGLSLGREYLIEFLLTVYIMGENMNMGGAKMV